MQSRVIFIRKVAISKHLNDLVTDLPFLNSSSTRRRMAVRYRLLTHLCAVSASFRAKMILKKLWITFQRLRPEEFSSEINEPQYFKNR